MSSSGGPKSVIATLASILYGYISPHNGATWNGIHDSVYPGTKEPMQGAADFIQQLKAVKYAIYPAIVVCFNAPALSFLPHCRRIVTEAIAGCAKKFLPNVSHKVRIEINDAGFKAQLYLDSPDIAQDALQGLMDCANAMAKEGLHFNLPPEPSAPLSWQELYGRIVQLATASVLCQNQQYEENAFTACMVYGSHFPVTPQQSLHGSLYGSIGAESFMPIQFAAIGHIWPDGIEESLPDVSQGATPAVAVYFKMNEVGDSETVSSIADRLLQPIKSEENTPAVDVILPDRLLPGNILCILLASAEKKAVVLASNLICALSDYACLPPDYSEDAHRVLMARRYQMFDGYSKPNPNYFANTTALIEKAGRQYAALHKATPDTAKSDAIMAIYCFIDQEFIENIFFVSLVNVDCPYVPSDVVAMMWLEEWETEPLPETPWGKYPAAIIVFSLFGHAYQSRVALLACLRNFLVNELKGDAKQLACELGCYSEENHVVSIILCSTNEEKGKHLVQCASRLLMTRVFKLQNFL